MKALLVLLAIAAGVWLFKRSPRRAPPPSPDARMNTRAGQPQPMLRCTRCGLHLPASDALISHTGRPYCCAAHRREAEGV